MRITVLDDAWALAEQLTAQASEIAVQTQALATEVDRLVALATALLLVSGALFVAAGVFGVAAVCAWRKERVLRGRRMPQAQALPPRLGVSHPDQGDEP